MDYSNLITGQVLWNVSHELKLAGANGKHPSVRNRLSRLQNAFSDLQLFVFGDSRCERLNANFYLSEQLSLNNRATEEDHLVNPASYDWEWAKRLFLQMGNSRMEIKRTMFRQTFWQQGIVFWLLAAFGFVIATCPSGVLAGLPDEQYQTLRAEIDSACSQSIEKMAETISQFGKKTYRIPDSRFLLSRDSNREYIFLPGSEFAPNTDEIASHLVMDHLKKSRVIEIEHASRLFDLAKKLAKSNPGRSYQLLNEVLFVYPDHEEARRILGWTKAKERWSRPNRSIKHRKPTRAHKLFKWKPANYSIIRSANFEIETSADAHQVQLIAEKMQRWREVWRQVAFDFWARPGTMERCFESGGKIRDSVTKRHKVVIFRNKEQYIQHLKPLIPGVEVSSGYYDLKLKTSFFYIGDDNDATWRHEMVHQLFQESVAGRKDLGDSGHIWAIEGIAMYFEPLQEFTGHTSKTLYCTLGGYESKRLQYARIRKLREGFYVPLTTLSRLSKDELMKQQNVAHIYTQSAGLAHMIMTLEYGKYKAPFLKWLREVYTKRRPADLQTFLKVPFPALDKKYDRFLTVQSNETKFSDYSVSKPDILCLRAGQLDSNAFQQLGNATQLGILDLGKTAVSDKDIEALGSCPHLVQLFLDETGLTDRCAPALTRIKELRELDIADTRITDRALDHIAKMENLQILWLSGTDISDEGLKKLAGLQNLTSIDVTRTRVTEKGLNWLKGQIKNLKSR